MTTPTTVESRSRWVSPASYAVLGALGATILAACTPSTGLDMTKPMSDGVWTAQSNADDQGSIGTITITVEGGRITATSYETTLADGTEYDLSGQWDKIDLYTSVSQALGEEVTVDTPREQLVAHAERIGLEVDDYAVAGKVVEDIFEELVGSKLWAPTFVYDFPEDTSPLTRYHRSRPGLTEKWDLYIRGFETATAYSELADPVVQRERFEAQALAAAKGDPEAMVLDEDFLVAMEQGFPPSGGMGMGIDRLLMVLTGQGIRETITFPLVKRS